MPLIASVTVTGSVTKQGAGVGLIAGLYGWTVPDVNVRHWVLLLVAVAIVTVPPLLVHDTGEAAVQLAKWNSSGIVAAVCDSGRNTSVGEKSSRPSPLPSAWS